jgi:hypothetical protein
MPRGSAALHYTGTPTQRAGARPSIFLASGVPIPYGLIELEEW